MFVPLTSPGVRFGFGNGKELNRVVVVDVVTSRDCAMDGPELTTPFPLQADRETMNTNRIRFTTHQLVSL